MIDKIAECLQRAFGEVEKIRSGELSKKDWREMMKRIRDSLKKSEDDEKE